MWPAFLTRPFGRLASPDASPDAIVISATESHPLSPDPRVVLNDQRSVLHRGARALLDLTNGPVFLCQTDGDALIHPDDPRLQVVTFTGPHPTGTAGPQIDLLCSVAKGGEVWTIGYQDVLAIGHLIETGRYDAMRVVALSGSLMRHPRLVRVPLGASLADLTKDALMTPKVRLISGSPLAGRASAYLGRYHRQITALDPVLPARKPPLSTHFAKRVLSPLVPTTALENALPFDIPPIPLMRALSIGDSESAERLGARALLEEDVAALTALCGSGADYGTLLRRVLSELEAAA